MRILRVSKLKIRALAFIALGLAHIPLPSQARRLIQLLLVKSFSRTSFNGFLTTITLPDQWSQRAGYQTLRATCDNHDATYFIPANLPGSLAPAYQDMVEDYGRGAAITCAEDVNVCLKTYKFPRLISGEPHRDQLFFHFSRNGDYLYKNNYLSTDTESLRFFGDIPFGGKAQVGEVSLLDWGGRRDYDRTLEGEYVFIGGRSNFTHFLFDHLPNLFFVEHFSQLADKTLVFTKLNSWQKQCLDVLGIGSNYVEIDAPESYGVTRFRRLWLPTRMPMLFRINYIRDRFKRSFSKEPGTRRIFLSRAKLEHNRIANEDEILSVAAARGFEVVYPEEMDIVEKIRVFSQAAIIISGIGSSEANFWAFAHSHTVLISLYPEFFFRPERHRERTVMATLGYHIPMLKQTVLVPGQQDEAVIHHIYNINQFQMMIECPARYELDAVQRAIDEAELRFAAGASQAAHTDQA